MAVGREQDVRPAEQILQQVLAGSAVKLSIVQESLLRERYIHRSSHWTPTKGFMLAKPAPDSRRNVFPDEPQQGYPQ